MAAALISLGNRYYVRHENNTGNFSVNFLKNSATDATAWEICHKLTTLQAEPAKQVEKTASYRVIVE
jgi:hypothetical protein